MHRADFDAFTALLDELASVLQPKPPLTGQALAIYFASLRNYTLETVRSALDAHTRDPERGRWFPKPADIVAQVEQFAADDGRPGAEEAWCLALGAEAETATVIWTGECATAWAAVAPLIRLGDHIAGRKAFIEVYSRLVVEARRKEVAVRWSVSLGHDANGRSAALEQAAELGRLKRADLLALAAPKSANGEALAANAPPNIRESLLRLRAELAGRVRHGLNRPSADAIERARTEALKCDARRMVEQYVEDDVSPARAA